MLKGKSRAGGPQPELIFTQGIGDLEKPAARGLKPGVLPSSHSEKTTLG